MSIVYITNHNENIYDASDVPKEVDVGQDEASESPAHKKVSSHRKDPRKFKKYGTMGPPYVAPPDPSHFLKKGTLKPPLRPPEESDSGRDKPLVAKKPFVPITKDVLKEQDERLGRWEQKNAIKGNIKQAIRMEPKVPERMTVVDTKGTLKPLKPSLEPTFLPSSQYGKLPRYLDTFLKEKEKRRIRMIQEAERSQPLCRYLTRDRRKNLLHGLKENWFELQCQYSLLPILTDTIPKKIRKSKLEADLKQLEADIVLIERHPYIYIYRTETLEK